MASLGPILQNRKWRRRQVKHPPKDHTVYEGEDKIKPQESMLLATPQCCLYRQSLFQVDTWIISIIRGTSGGPFHLRKLQVTLE